MKNRLLVWVLLAGLPLCGGNYSSELDDILASVDREYAGIQEKTDEVSAADKETDVPQAKPTFWQKLFEKFTVVRLAKEIPVQAKLMFNALSVLRRGRMAIVYNREPFMIPKMGSGSSDHEVLFENITSRTIAPDARISLIAVYNNMGVLYPIQFIQSSVAPLFKEVITWLKGFQFFFPTTRMYLDVPLVNQILNIVFDDVLTEIIKNTTENINLSLKALQDVKKVASQKTLEGLYGQDRDQELLDEKANEDMKEDSSKANVPEKRSFWKWVTEFGTLINNARKIPTEAKKLRTLLNKLKNAKIKIKPSAEAIMIPEKGLGFGGGDPVLKSVDATDMNAKERLAWILIYNNMVIAYAIKFLQKSIMPLCTKVVGWLRELQGLWKMSRAFLDLGIVEQLLKTISEKVLNDVEKNSMDNIQLSLARIKGEREAAKLEKEALEKEEDDADEQEADQEAA